MSETTVAAPARGGWAQPAIAGLVAALVGFAGSFAIVLAGLHAVGASDAQASSGLLVLSLGMGLTGAGLSYRYKMPLSVAWSTPGAALLITAGHVDGGYPAAIGAFLLAGVLVVVTGLSERLTRAIVAIPGPLASGLLAGVLLQVCVAPAQAMVQVPGHAAPVIATWLVLWIVARRWAVPGALAAAAITVAVDPAPGAHAAHLLPQLTFTMPHLNLGTLIGVGLPLFVVTMVTQNVAGISVLAAHGYATPVRPALTTTGTASIVGAPFGAHAINLAAITAAMAAGPDAGPDPKRRWIAGSTSGLVYVVLGPLAGLATVLLAASPVVLIEAVAGLALLGTLGAALRAAMADDDLREAAVATFVVSASGISAFGISAPFWGLVAGMALLGAQRARTLVA
ncbi:Inner membrane protein YdcO [Baekduia alba]|uniref:benzoate/H(+) symporter BenE family transporter n=1 Tax=Baekduia alba TaxID=2997333 RepID=UPI002340C9CE|nr:benzoate/H(+) symporter BenE family transporter [Baekduia alba]WCB94508.1 Inner membrane protein YdcO [Baekduia alba]